MTTDDYSIGDVVFGKSPIIEQGESLMVVGLLHDTNELIVKHELTGQRVTVKADAVAVLTYAPKQSVIPQIKAPRIRRTAQLKALPTVFISNGTPIVIMPDGSPMPGQTDVAITIEQPLRGTGPMPIVTATVRLLVNLADSAFVDEDE